MTGHAMKYVSMADKVLEEQGAADHIETYMRLLEARDAVLGAEIALVRAYGHWHDAMTRAAAQGSPLASEYLRRTTWDLT